MWQRDNRGIIHACVRAYMRQEIHHVYFVGVMSAPGRISVYDADASLKSARWTTRLPNVAL